MASLQFQFSSVCKDISHYNLQSGPIFSSFWEGPKSEKKPFFPQEKLEM